LKKKPISKELRSDILVYFSNPNAPFSVKKDRKVGACAGLNRGDESDGADDRREWRGRKALD